MFGANYVLYMNVNMSWYYVWPGRGGGEASVFYVWGQACPFNMFSFSWGGGGGSVFYLNMRAGVSWKPGSTAEWVWGGGEKCVMYEGC
jgi:hypothetical protein